MLDLSKHLRGEENEVTGRRRQARGRGRGRRGRDNNKMNRRKMKKERRRGTSLKNSSKAFQSLVYSAVFCFGSELELEVTA